MSAELEHSASQRASPLRRAGPPVLPKTAGIHCRRSTSVGDEETQGREAGDSSPKYTRRESRNSHKRHPGRVRRSAIVLRPQRRTAEKQTEPQQTSASRLGLHSALRLDSESVSHAVPAWITRYPHPPNEPADSPA